MQPVEHVSSLEVGQAETGHDVRATDDQDAQVDEEEQKLGARRQCGDDDDQRDDDELYATNHGPDSARPGYGALRLFDLRFHGHGVEQLTHDQTRVDVADGGRRLDDRAV